MNRIRIWIQKSDFTGSGSEKIFYRIRIRIWEKFLPDPDLRKIFTESGSESEKKFFLPDPDPDPVDPVKN